MKKNAPDKKKGTRVKVEGTDAQKEFEFDKQTNDMKFTQEWNTW